MCCSSASRRLAAPGASVTVDNSLISIRDWRCPKCALIPEQVSTLLKLDLPLDKPDSQWRPVTALLVCTAMKLRQ